VFVAPPFGIFHNEGGSFNFTALSFGDVINSEVGTIRSWAVGDLTQDGDIDLVVCDMQCYLYVQDRALDVWSSTTAGALTSYRHHYIQRISLLDFDGGECCIDRQTPTPLLLSVIAPHAHRFLLHPHFTHVTPMSLLHRHTCALSGSCFPHLRRIHALLPVLLITDGDLDVFFNTPRNGSKLCRNDGSLNFVDMSDPFGVDTGLSNNELILGDYDADGDVDALVVVGLGNTQLLHNDGGGRFTSVAPGSVSLQIDRGDIAFADLDNDADLDIVLGHWGQNEIFFFEHCPGGVRFGLSQACLTVPTYARRAANGDHAFECPANRQRFDVLTSCNMCAPGFERPFGAVECVECGLGHAQVQRAAACETCVLRSRTLDPPTFGLSRALDMLAPQRLRHRGSRGSCRPGSYANFHGSVRCFPCAIGNFSSQPAAAECDQCPAGKFSSVPGASSCSDCATGGFCAAIGAVSASMTFEACPAGVCHACLPLSCTTPPRESL
jgi:hypothetical protein